MEISPPSNVHHSNNLQEEMLPQQQKIELYGHLTKLDFVTMAYEHFWRLSMCQVCVNVSICHTNSYAAHPDL